MPENTSGTVGGLGLGDYLRVLWRWKWLIVIAVCASTLAAYAYSLYQVPQYRATAELLYVAPVDPTNPLANSYSTDARDLAVENIVNVMGSPAIKNGARSILKGGAAGKYSVATSVQGGSTAGTGGVIDVSATGGNPRAAAAVATAYAQAAVSWSKQQQLERVTAAERAVEANLAGFTTDTSRLTTDYIMLKQNLRSLKLFEMTASGDFQLISPAIPPASPFAPQPLQSAALGLGVGLLVGVGLAFLLNQLTTRVHGTQEAGEVLGLPVVGSLPEIERRSLQKGRIVALTDPDGQTAEALRLLRSNLDYINVDGASSLLVTSALAGEGKSTTVCNLAVTIAMAGKEVVVVDGDLRRPRVHEYFRLPNDIGLSSVAAGDVALADALMEIDLPPTLRPGDNSSGPDIAERVRGKRTPVVLTAGLHGTAPDVTERVRGKRRLVVLTSGPHVPDPGELVASQRFGDIIRELQSATVDLVIVDSPALMEVGDAAAMAAQIEALVTIVDLDKAHHSTLVEMRHLLAPLPCKKLGVILVKTKSRSSKYGYYD